MQKSVCLYSAKVWGTVVTPKIREDFIAATEEMFRSMFGIQIQLDESQNGAFSPEVISFVGISGPARGMVCMEFPADTALAVVATLVGHDVNEVDATVRDGAAELINMVAGGAKAKMSGDDGPVMELGLPTVVIGKDYKVNYPSKTEWTELPFMTDIGPFRMRVLFEAVKETEGK